MARAAGVVLVSAVLLVSVACQKSEQPAASSPATESSAAAAPQTGDVAIKDPHGAYKLFSDPSITKPPADDLVFGNGQTITIEYDGSKTTEGDSVFYALYYVDQSGSVHPITSSSFEGRTKGTFTTSNKVFNSSADGRPGFIEISVVQNVKVVGGDQGITGKNLTLGMYPIKKFEVSE